MSDKHVKSQETLHDVKVTDEDGLLSRSMMIKAKDIIMNERIIAVREEPNYTFNPTARCETQWVVVEHRVEESGAGRFMKHDPDIQQHDGEGTNSDRSCRSARLCFSLCTVTVERSSIFGQLLPSTFQ